MASKRGKYHYKIDKLRGLLSPQDLTEFDSLCQWNPTYASIRGWFALRGHKISINAIHHWWKASFLSAAESRILREISMELGQDFDQPPYNSVLRLVVTAAQILCDHSTSRLTNVEPQMLLKKHIELFAGAREMAMSSHLSKL